jgi:hypothetical protein
LANEESSKEGALIGKWEQINDECSDFVDGLFAGMCLLAKTQALAFWIPQKQAKTWTCDVAECGDGGTMACP